MNVSSQTKIMASLPLLEASIICSSAWRRRICATMLGLYWLTLLPSFCTAQDPPGCTRLATGQKIYYQLLETMFPAQWRKPPISARAEAIDSVEVDRSLHIVRAALAKYPARLLKGNLNNIYLVKNFYCNEAAYGGTWCEQGNALYINNNGGRDYTEEFIEGRIHHEFAHLLLSLHYAQFSLSLWKGLNTPDFRYGRGGLEGIKNGDTDLTIDETWNKRGFVSQYAATDAYEDFACTVEYLFSGSSAFWAAVEKYPTLRSKAQMAIKFYNGLNKQFTEEYFRGLLKGKEAVIVPSGGEVIVYPDGSFGIRHPPPK